MTALRAIARAISTLAALATLATSASSQAVDTKALATVNTAMCLIDKAELGWPAAMPMTPYPWRRHPTWPNSFYFNGVIADPMKGAVLTYQLGAGEEVMKSVKEGLVNRETTLKYITFNYHVKEKLTLGKDYSDRGMPKLYAVSGTQGDMKTIGYAGYAKGYTVYFAMNASPQVPLDQAWVDGIFFKWLARFPNVEIAESVALGVEVLPSMQDVPSDVGLIPATDQLPANLSVKGLTPNAGLTVSIPDASLAELRSSGVTSGGKTLALKTDALGSAEVQLFAKIADKTAKPYSVRVHFQSEDGKSLDATVHVGLSLAIAEVRPLKGDGGVNKVLAPWPLLVGVKSLSHPEINVAKYLDRADSTHVWGSQTLAVDLKTDWLNEPASSPSDSVYWATTNVFVDLKLGGNTILGANGSPKYVVNVWTYPAVVLYSGGEHLYHVSAYPVVMNVADRKVAEASKRGLATHEPWLANDQVVVLSGNDPDGWFSVFQAGACALEPTSTEQEIYIGLLKTFPATAPLAGDITGVASIACNFAKGDYSTAFLDFGKMLGTKYIERLADPKAIKNLTPREQKMVEAAKLFTDEVDKSEKEDEKDKLKANLKKKFDEEMKALYPN